MYNFKLHLTHYKEKPWQIKKQQIQKREHQLKEQVQHIVAISIAPTELEQNRKNVRPQRVKKELVAKTNFKF